MPIYCWLLKFNMESLLNSDLLIIFTRINNRKIISWEVWPACLTWLQMIGYSRRWSAMLLYPSGQISDCFNNVNVICIVQTFEFIDYIGQERQGSMALQWKIFFHFEICENNSNVNTVIFFKNNSLSSDWI